MGSLNLFWDYDKTLPLMGVRDIYQLEFDLFQSAGWVAFYMASVVIYGTCQFGMEQMCGNSKVWYSTRSPKIGEVVWMDHFLGSRGNLFVIPCILHTPSHNGLAISGNPPNVAQVFAPYLAVAKEHQVYLCLG